MKSPISPVSIVLVTLSCLTLCDPMDRSHQVPLSMQFSRQEYWSRLPFPSPGDLPDPGIEPRSPTLGERSLHRLFLPAEPPGSIILSETWTSPQCHSFPAIYQSTQQPRSRDHDWALCKQQKLLESRPGFKLGLATH